MPKEEVVPVLWFSKEPSAEHCGVFQHLCMWLEFPAFVSFGISTEFLFCFGTGLGRRLFAVYLPVKAASVMSQLLDCM